MLGLDAVIDYKADDLGAALKAAAPGGVDLYFDNVGGSVLDTVLMQIKHHARVVLCGGISQYGSIEHARGPSNYLQLIAQSATMQGFTMMDFMHRVPEAQAQILTWQQAGQLQFRQHMLHGIECFPQAFDMIFSGANQGKLLIDLQA